MRISIAGRVDDRGFHQCRVIARALVDANTHVSVDLLPLMETQWEDFVRVTAAVGVRPQRLQIADSRCKQREWLRRRGWGGVVLSRMWVGPVYLLVHKLPFLHHDPPPPSVSLANPHPLCPPPPPPHPLPVPVQAMGGRASEHRLSPLVVYNDSEYIGGADDFYHWAQTALRYEGKAPNPILYNQVRGGDGHAAPSHLRAVCASVWWGGGVRGGRRISAQSVHPNGGGVIVGGGWGAAPCRTLTTVGAATGAHLCGPGIRPPHVLAQTGVCVCACALGMRCNCGCGRAPHPPSPRADCQGGVRQVLGRTEERVCVHECQCGRRGANAGRV